MKITWIKISNFQSFTDIPVQIPLCATTYILGPNGAGKTAVLQALSRLFGFDPSLRRVRSTDFHVSSNHSFQDPQYPLGLWIEAQFEFPELRDDQQNYATIPSNFAHMRLESADGVPRIRIRLSANLFEEGDIEETLVYVLEANANGEPTKTAPVPKHDRNAIQIHYLPARRDPSDHISYATNSLLGRALRAASWQTERDGIQKLTQTISESLAGNAAVAGIGAQLSAHWKTLHKGSYFADPSVSFARNEIESLLRHLTVGFSPGHGEMIVDYSRLPELKDDSHLPLQ